MHQTHPELQRVHQRLCSSALLWPKTFRYSVNGRQMLWPCAKRRTVHEPPTLLGLTANYSAILRAEHDRTQDLKPGRENNSNRLVVHLELSLTVRPAPRQTALTHGRLHRRINACTRFSVSDPATSPGLSEALERAHDMDGFEEI